MILPILASQVVRITGVSHGRLAIDYTFLYSRISTWLSSLQSCLHNKVSKESKKRKEGKREEEGGREEKRKPPKDRV
jgi:hypothetical protein